jgi:hypothetical protein
MTFSFPYAFSSSSLKWAQTPTGANRAMVHLPVIAMQGKLMEEPLFAEEGVKL